MPLPRAMESYSPERWQSIGSRFAAVLELPAAERAAYLDRSCSTDAELRSAVERLLRAHDRAANFLIGIDDARVATLFDDADDAADADELTGTIGPYTILRRLGRGGMGIVYLAHDSRLGRAVALKVLAPHLGNDAAARRHFAGEARAASAMQHPHIATIYDIGDTPQGTLYIAMAYYEGETLRERLRRGPLDIEHARRIALQLADALAAAHRRGVVHRDVKPGNVIVDADGSATLLDFGIAALAGVDGERHAAGTAAYMSPEQTRGEAPDPAHDVWSYGATLYEALTGRRPFRARDGATTVEAIRHDALIPIRTLRPEVPASLAALVERCLARPPSERPATGSELLAALSVLGASASEGARRARVMRYAAVGAVALAVSAAIGLVRRAPADEPAPLAGAAIAVLPFSAAADTTLARLGRELAITLSANLDEVGELRTIDSQTILAQPELERTVTTARQRGVLARRLGASRVLYGTLVRSGDELRLDAQLVDARSGRALARASITRAPMDIVALTDSVTWIVLRQLHGDARDGRVDAGLLMTRSLVALRAFLEGERLVAEGRMRQAPEAYARAFAADSTFWLAYWRYAQARGYWGDPVEPRIQRAYEDHRRELPLRDRLLIELRATDSLSQRLDGARTLTNRFPDYWPGWWELVEQLVHNAPFLGTTRPEAAAALDQLLRLHPGYALAWEHRLWLALSDRDTATAGRAIARLTELDYDRASLDEGGVPILPLYRYMDRAARRGGVADPALAQRALAGLAGYTGNIPHDSFAAGTSSYGYHAANIDLLRQLIALDGVPAGIVAGARRGIAIAWAARGDWNAAMLAMRDYVRQVDGYEPVLHAYRLASFGAWLGALPDGAAEEWEPSLRRQQDRLAPPVRAELAWWRGVRAAGERDASALAEARAELPASGYRFAPLLDGSLAALQKAIDGDSMAAAAALVELERHRAQLRLAIGPANLHPYLTAVNRLAASRWLLAGGDTASAAELLTWTEAVVPYSYHVSHVDAFVAGYVYPVRAAIEEARGRWDRAAALYRFYLDRVDLPAGSERARAEHAAVIASRHGERR